jgi:hypothetical protein
MQIAEVIGAGAIGPLCQFGQLMVRQLLLLSLFKSRVSSLKRDLMIVLIGDRIGLANEQATEKYSDHELECFHYAILIILCVYGSMMSTFIKKFRQQKNKACIIDAGFHH